MAGTTIAALEAVCGGSVVRAMPNTPAAIGRGITVAVAAKNVSAAQRAIADALLRATGSVEWVDDESLMDAVTAVSGSGPAYVFLLAEELARAGVEAGLPAELATKLARETVAGSGELLHRSELASATLRQNVTSPGGTTAAALEVLMGQDGLQPLLIARGRRGDAAFEGIWRSRLVILMVRRRAAPSRTMRPDLLGIHPSRRALRAPQDEVEQRSYFPAKPLVNVSALTRPRAWRPSPILRSPSKASTSKRITRRSTAMTFRRDPHRRADQRRAEMADIDLGADRDPAGLQIRPDGVAGGHLHFQDHHRRRIDHRHAGHEMPDRALGRHDQRPLGAHADLDEVACVHG